MRSKLAALFVALLAFTTACASDDPDPADDGTTAQRTDGAPDNGNGDGNGGAKKTPKIDEADEGEVNRPKAGTYVYDYSSQSTNASTPDSPPRRSEEGAELTSKVSYDGDQMSIEEKTTEGPAVALATRRWTDDEVVELHFETRSPQGTVGCDLDPPIDVLRFPLETGKYDTQEFAGKGTSCEGERTIEVGSQEDVEDADGVTWSTWKITVTNVAGSSQGMSSKSVVTNWFSPDLGKEIRIESTVQAVDSEGAVKAEGETEAVLKTYPT